MNIRLCTLEDLPAVSAFYDDVTAYLEEHINYPKWTPGIYPCYNSAKTRNRGDSRVFIV